MVLIGIDQQTFECGSDETVLQCLENNNCAPPSSCRSGMCHTCMMRAIDEVPPQHAQIGLKESLQAQNYFLPCICIPEKNMRVAYADDVVAPSTQITLIEKTRLSSSVVRLRFKADSDYEYRAGQFTNLFRDKSLTRSYSIASVPNIEDYLEFHVEKIANGKMSNWIFSELSIGDMIKISAPLGECFYSDKYKNSNLLLIATGTGLAPIYGVLRDAVNRGHKGMIHIFHGAATREKLYLVDELREISSRYENVQYTPSLTQETEEGVAQGRANEIALDQHKDLKGWAVYLCGHPDMVNSAKRKVFLAGADLNNIFADPFEFAT